ncbi:RHS repeat-associated core domain-containing protein [Roseburia sp. AF20-18LB]|nr:RHS repeat-associated core domain-containing protein [Roseburia sp. AF20-18LB]
MEENGKLVSFIYADREVIAEEDEAGEHIRYIRGHELLASDSERARTYYHYACDEMGSITDITDCHGTVLNHYAYDAFGNRTVEEETVENRFGFAGELLDAVTGQYYLRARFYNPVRYVDPNGHEGLICSKKYGELKKKRPREVLFQRKKNGRSMNMSRVRRSRMGLEVIVRLLRM